MRMLVLTFLLLCLSANTKLLYVDALIRHGSRYPTGDLYNAASYKSFEGTLTGVGMRQQYNLGTYLKQNYIAEYQLLNPKSDPNQIEIFSTSYERNMLSADAFLYGFYPLGEGWTIPPEVPAYALNPPFQQFLSQQEYPEPHLRSDGQPFALNKGMQVLPVFPQDEIFDSCPNYGVLISNRLKEIGQSIATMQATFTVQIAKMNLIFNLTALQSTIPIMADLYDVIFANQNLGTVLPKDYNQNDDLNMKFIAEYYRTLVFEGNFGKLLSTPVLSLIRNNLNLAIKDTKKKMSLHFVHQSNLIPLMITLNLTSSDCLNQKYKKQQVTALNCMVPAKFAANLLLQLHEDDSFQHFIKIRYNGEYAYVCESKQFECRLDQFLSRVKATEVPDYTSQCKTTSSENVDVKDKVNIHIQ